MVNFGEIFTELMDSSPLSIAEIALGLGCKQPNLYKLKQKESVDAQLLEKVCRLFEVSPLIFFDEDVLKNEIPANRLQNKNNVVLGKALMNIGALDDIRNLKAMLEEKNKQLEDKERFIRYLLNEKSPS